MYSEVVDVLGNISEQGRAQVAADAGRAVETWFDNAFLKATYPTASFPDAFASFSPGAATIAAGDAAVLTNAGIGDELNGSLHAVAKEARFVVFARDNQGQGASGDVVLEATGRNAAAGEVTIRVTGDVYLSRSDNGWRIVGYRVLNEVTGPDVDVASSTAATR